MAETTKPALSLADNTGQVVANVLVAAASDRAGRVSFGSQRCGTA
ncbi:MAG: hypothetical protein ABI227_06355 [Rhodanobacter sp.]